MNLGESSADEEYSEPEPHSQHHNTLISIKVPSEYDSLHLKDKMAVVASTSSRTVPSSSWQESKTSEKPEQRADPTGVEDVDSSTATTDAKDKEISDLQMRLELYKNYLGEVARFRQPKSSSTRKPKVIDPKWVRGLEIPVAAHQQRLYDPIVIVFDPISATFASMNEKLALSKHLFADSYL